MKAAMIGNQHGFTIIEVVVAVLILGLAYVAILQNFSLSMHNIHRIETKQNDMFLEMLSFEELLQNSDEEELPDGTVFLEGGKYRLVEIENESGSFVTLVMEKL